MSIPIQMPPPSDAAIGWTPNALVPPLAQIVQTIDVTPPLAVPVITAASVGTGARLIVLRRRLNSVELDSAIGTLFPIATATGGVVLIPVFATSMQSNSSASGYNTTEGLGVRCIGGAADLITIQGMDNTVGPQDRVYNQLGAALVNVGTFALAQAGLTLRQTFRPIFLGVPGTDSANFVEISIFCFAVIP